MLISASSSEECSALNRNSNSHTGWLAQALIGQQIDLVRKPSGPQPVCFFIERDFGSCFPGGLRYPNISTRCSDRRGGSPCAGLWPQEFGVRA